MDEISKWSRKNGWSWPPHPLQILAWLAIIFLVSMSLVIAMTFSALAVRISVTLIFVVLISVVSMLAIYVTSIDPSDEGVRHKIRKRPQPSFDKKLHNHVISTDYYCNICQEIVHPTSKHCRQCNKCVLDFDHHCKWLNNCIGARSYRWFLIFIGFCTLSSGVISVVGLIQIVFYFENPNLINHQNNTVTICGTEIGDVVWLVLTSITFLLATIACLLNLHLFVFHIKLVHKGITTYNFMRQEKKRNEELKNMKVNSKMTNGWIGEGAQTRPVSAQDGHGTRLHSISGDVSSTSTVPKLPPINIPDNEELINRKHKMVNDSSTVPYSILENDQKSSPLSDKNKAPATVKSETLVSRGISTEQSPIQPSISPNSNSHTPTTLFIPEFETVLTQQRELTLPSIFVTDDSDWLQESLNDIPLQTIDDVLQQGACGIMPSTTDQRSTPSQFEILRDTAKNRQPGSTVYVARGHITVAKVVDHGTEKNDTNSTHIWLNGKEVNKSATAAANRNNRGIGVGGSRPRLNDWSSGYSTVEDDNSSSA